MLFGKGLACEHVFVRTMKLFCDVCRLSARHFALCQARNVVDLGDHFTVTKDNQYRFIVDLR